MNIIAKHKGITRLTALFEKGMVAFDTVRRGRRHTFYLPTTYLSSITYLPIYIVWVAAL